MIKRESRDLVAALSFYHGTTGFKGGLEDSDYLWCTCP